MRARTHIPRYTDDCFLYLEYLFPCGLKLRQWPLSNAFFWRSSTAFEFPCRAVAWPVSHSIGSTGFASKMTQGERMGILARGEWDMPQETTFAISLPGLRCLENLSTAR